jgi:hypothetical protein
MGKQKQRIDTVDIGKSGIWVYDKRDWVQVSNFGLKLLYHITDSRGDVLWQMAILDGDQEIYIELNHLEFSTAAKFHAALLRKGYVFKGESSELNAIKEHLIKDAKQAQRVEILGQHPSGLYFFCNGALTPDGVFIAPNQFQMIEYDAHVWYLPFANSLQLKQYKSVSRFIYRENAVEPVRWLDLLTSAYGKTDSVLPVAFYVAALFRDLAFARKHFFPILYFEGPRGSGKSVRARSLTSAFGYPQAEVNLMSPNTPKSLPRLLEQMSNAVLWFDEYRNALPADIRAMLQAAYDGGGYHRANISQDNTTTSIEILSGIILTSNEIPDYDVFLSRCVVCVYNETQKTEEQKTAFDALRNLEEQGLSAVTAWFLSKRATIKKEWETTFNELSAYIRKTTDRIDTRVIENIALILTPLQILHAQKLLNLRALFGVEDCQEVGRDAVILNQSLLIGKSDLTIFFETLAAGMETRKLQIPVDMKKVKCSKANGSQALAIRLHRCVNFYQKELRQTQNRLGLGKQELETLLKQHPAYINDAVTVHFKSEKGKDSPSKAMTFNYPVLARCFGLDW